MITEAISKIIQLAQPNVVKLNGLEYADKSLSVIAPPSPGIVMCSTLQGLVDLFNGELDDVKSEGDILVHITSPTEVEIINRKTDNWGRRHVLACAKYPEVKTFPFGAWLDPENFIIQAQQHFQRVKIEKDDGTFARDLDYVLNVAGHITAEHATENVDDGFAQRVAVRQGVALKAETILRPMVQLAPYRTFAEIDQVVSQFVFRARVQNGTTTLALFEGDGGRWKIAATAAVLSWLEDAFTDKGETTPEVTIIS